MFLFTILLLIGTVWRAQAVPATCTAVYAARPGHTYCLEDSADFTSGGVSDADKVAILQAHNDFRSAVNPTAANMEKMVWSDVLAGIAQKWTQSCTRGHDADRWTVEYYAGSGQNAGRGQSSWTDVITAWHGEVSVFEFGVGKTTTDAVIGHYTQVVQDGASIIGCGYSDCSGVAHYVCNYKEGNYGGNSPYKSGATCADCPNKCVNKLCDCDGLYCHNGGTKDIATCTCSCTAAYTGADCLTERCPGLRCENHGSINVATCTCDCHKYGTVYSGTTCTTKTCPFKEPDSCATEQNCAVYWNAPLRCPYKCGLCTEAERPATCSADPSCHESGQGCYYMGAQPDTATCATHGTAGLDTWACEYKGLGGSYVCASCEQYRNIKTDYCPVMCAYCPHPTCGTKICRNGGTINDASCVCTCTNGFSGTECETEQCPGLTCQNGGQIVGGSCTCSCANGYTGTNCETAPCAGKTCQNHGTIDATTCTCTCYNHVYGGDLCETLSCPVQEDSSCPSKAESTCSSDWSVPFKCPYKCGLCAESDRPTCDADPNCHKSAGGCTYIGAQDDAAACAKHGSSGNDYSVCGTSWGCSYCTDHSNVKTDYCPKFCALCPA